MTKKQFDREMQYQAMAVIAQRMLDEGVITKKEFTRIESNLNDKYNPVFRLQ